MKTSGFLLFRLNFVDRQNLFENPIRTDSDFQRVIETAASEDFDVVKQGPRSGFRWALREITTDFAGGEDEPYIFGFFSYEVTSRRGPIITPRGIAQGTSMVSPPSATLVRVVIHLKRHILAIEDIPSIIKPGGGWKTSLQTILDTAAWNLGFTSLIHLDPLIPTEIVETRIKQFDRITRLRVTLRIPNPDLGPSFRRLYEEMKEGGIRELTEDMRNERGLTLTSETLPQAALDMAMKGYRKGKIHVYGVRNGQRDEFTVADDVARIEVEELRDFIEGYAAGNRSTAVRRFAQSLIQRIDDSVSK